MATEVNNLGVGLSSAVYGASPRDSSKKSDSRNNGNSDIATEKQLRPQAVFQKRSDSSPPLSPPLSSGANSILAQEAGSLPVQPENSPQAESPDKSAAEAQSREAQGLPQKLSDKNPGNNLESAASAEQKKREADKQSQAPEAQSQNQSPQAGPQLDENGLPVKLSDKDTGIRKLSDKDEQQPQKLSDKTDNRQSEQLQADRQKEASAYFRDGLSKPFTAGSDLYGNNLNGQSLQGGQFEKADFRTGSLAGANLKGGDFRNADFSGADLTGADLRGANLEGANFTGAFIAGAQLEGAKGTKYDVTGKLTLDRANTLSRIDLRA